MWACPVCASKIQERRRLEIEHAIQWAESEGLVPVMVTFTFPHQSWQRLRDLIRQQRQAFKLLRKGKAWDRLKARGGLIRSLEVTHGRNGWHPHTHELWFCDPDNLPTYDRLVPLWESACRRAGLLTYRPDDPGTSMRWVAFMEHSVDVKLDMTAGDYLAKQDDSRSWGFSHEVAKATSKVGRAKGVHPHHFLVRKAPGDRERFLEYVDAMKGSRQLFWSPGLKDRCQLQDLDDNQVAEESREDADLLATLTHAQWSLVRGNDARAELLDAAEAEGLPGIRALLAALGDSPPASPDPDAPPPGPLLGWSLAQRRDSPGGAREAGSCSGDARDGSPQASPVGPPPW
ncbi:protein rep [Halomonas coralii]|uniref:protein rep n=1 Tax=Modicisalibacter sp. R2A 31.J TaxID=2831898 RepID=UPI001CCDFD62|nr:protein rep [Modicisalibacter sp. R2A 31.J]